MRVVKSTPVVVLVAVAMLVGATMVVSSSVSAVGVLDEVVELPAARLWDTRTGGETVDGIGAEAERPAAGESVQVPVASRGGVPLLGVAGVDVVVSLEVPPGSVAGSASVYLCGTPVPDEPDVTWDGAGIVTGVGVAPVSLLGDLCLWVSAEVDVVVDVVGWLPGVPGLTDIVGLVWGWRVDNGRGIDPEVTPAEPAPDPGPEGDDVDGDGFVDDVPVDVGVGTPEVTRSGGGRWRVRLGTEPAMLADDQISVTAADDDDVGRWVLVEMLAPDEVDTVGYQGAALSVAPVDWRGDVDVEVGLSYANLLGLFGGDWPQRVEVRGADGCVWDLDVPGYAEHEPGCVVEPGDGEVATVNNDLDAGWVTGVMSFHESHYLTGPLGVGLFGDGGLLDLLLGGIIDDDDGGADAATTSAMPDSDDEPDDALVDDDASVDDAQSGDDDEPVDDVPVDDEQTVDDSLVDGEQPVNGEQPVDDDVPVDDEQSVGYATNAERDCRIRGVTGLA